MSKQNLNWQRWGCLLSWFGADFFHLLTGSVHRSDAPLVRKLRSSWRLDVLDALNVRKKHLSLDYRDKYQHSPVWLLETQKAHSLFPVTHRAKGFSRQTSREGSLVRGGSKESQTPSSRSQSLRTGQLSAFHGFASWRSWHCAKSRKEKCLLEPNQTESLLRCLLVLQRVRRTSDEDCDVRHASIGCDVKWSDCDYATPSYVVNIQ